MTRSAASEYVTLRIVDRFQCIGPACEAHCCGSWQVPVDESHYFKLRMAMDGSRAERDEFRDTHDRNRAARSGTRKEAFALMTLRDDGNCSMLETGGLCSIQRRYGEPLLPDVCATYPRWSALVGARVERMVQLSCPEAARLGLLGDEGMETAVMAPDGLVRGRVNRVIDVTQPWARYLDDVRATALRLLSLTRFPVETRLFFTTWFAHRTAGFLHAGVTEDPGERLAAEIVQLERDTVLDELARQYSDLTVPPALAETIATWMLGTRVQTGLAAFRDFVGQSLAAFSPAGGASDAAQLFESYRQQRASLPSVLRARMDRHLARCAQHHWLIRPYVDSPDLPGYVFDLALRLAVLRLLLVGHPQTRAARDAAGTEEQVRRFDAAAVEVTWRLSRALDHQPQFVRSLAEQLVKLGLHGFPHAVALTKF